MSVKLTSRLPQIARELDARVGAAAKQGAEDIANEARDRVPYGQNAPHLRDHIKVVERGGRDWGVVAGDRDTFYGHMIEYGTVRSAAHPFLIPAFESRRRAVNLRIKRALVRL